MWGRGTVSLPLLSGSLRFPATQIKLLAFPSIRALHRHSTAGKLLWKIPPRSKMSPVLRKGLCSVTPFRNFRSELGEWAGCPGSPNPPGLPRPPVPGRVSSCGRLVAPCADRTARSAGWHGRMASRFAFCSSEWASPSFSEPDGHAFGFSFNHVTFARRIKEQEQLLAAAAGASPALPEETT